MSDRLAICEITRSIRTVVLTLVCPPGGKSAVLTAVTIVLGGRTSSTGRGSGMNDLIRSGAQ